MVALQRFALFLAVLMLSALTLAAIDPDDFATDSQRVRYHQFVADLRCPKCQNQNLAGSDAPIANDLRKELRRLLKEGQSDQQIIDFMVTRYGDFILYKPPFDKHTAVLWLAPVGLLAFGIAVIGTIVWRHRRARAENLAPLTATEQSQLADLLRETTDKSPKSATRGKRA
ncbi:MAG: cytochrome c-type biogenesis protein [Spongiibacteraceae bacterium]